MRKLALSLVMIGIAASQAHAEELTGTLKKKQRQRRHRGGPPRIVRSFLLL